MNGMTALARLLALFVTLALTTGAAATDRNVQLVADIGPIDASKATQHTFHFTSPWDDRVEIVATKVGCAACTRVITRPDAIEPGEVHAVTIEVRPGRERGSHTYRATLVGSGGRLVQCTLRAFLAGARAVPAEVALGQLTRGDIRRRGLRLEYFGPRPAGVRAHVGPGPLRVEPVGAGATAGEATAFDVRLELRGADIEQAGPYRTVAAFDFVDLDTGEALDQLTVVVHALLVDADADAADAALSDVVARVRSFAREHGRPMTRDELRDAAMHPRLADGSGETLARRQRAVVAAWESTRGSTPVSIETLGQLFALKRDSIRSVEAEFRLHVAIDADRAPGDFDSAAPSTAYRFHQAFHGEQRRLEVVPLDRPDAGVRRCFDGRLEGVLDLGSGVGWIGVPQTLEVYLDHVEPWHAAGGLVGDRRRGTSRARETDLASLLLDSPAGAATVDTAHSRVDGADCVVVRYGWSDPIEIHLDAAIGFAPRFMREQLELDGETIEVTTRFTDFVAIRADLWLPRRIVRRQATADALDTPYLVVEMTAERLEVNAVGAAAFDVSGIFTDDATVVDRRTGIVRSGRELRREQVRPR